MQAKASGSQEFEEFEIPVEEALLSLARLFIPKKTEN